MECGNVLFSSSWSEKEQLLLHTSLIFHTRAFFSSSHELDFYLLHTSFLFFFTQTLFSSFQNGKKSLFLILIVLERFLFLFCLHKRFLFFLLLHGSFLLFFFHLKFISSESTSSLTQNPSLFLLLFRILLFFSEVSCLLFLEFTQDFLYFF